MGLLLRPGWDAYCRFVNWLYANEPEDLKALIDRAPKTGLRVAVIGTGISGVQAMKSCLAEGMEPVAFEADADLGGFWRYKEDADHPSVYRSTHIDTDRDQNSFGDYPWGSDKPLLLHNTDITEYLRANAHAFGLLQRIRFRTRVRWVTPEGKEGANRWAVTSSTADPASGEEVTRTEVFDGVMVCTGRHGGGGFIPRFPGIGDFKGMTVHSSKYKYPEKHGLLGKTVVVVGIGNSGCDIVTELGPQLAKSGGRCILVARSGGWVGRAPHGELLWSRQTGDRVYVNLYWRLPWWWLNERAEKAMAGRQAVLNKHGLEPKHKLMQQHGIITGLAGQVPLHDQLEKGWITVRRGIDRFVENGIVFTGEEAPTAVDAVIFATGYRHVAPFVDPKIVDMRFERDGNDVPLYKGCLAISPYKGLGFVNFVQTNTFMAAELHGRLFTRVLRGLVKLPPLAEQRAEMERVRNALSAQYIDRQQLRVQHGVGAMYYDDIAELLGCYPSMWKLLTQRPSAIWHGWFAAWMPLQWRLVGPGRLGNAEQKIEELYRSRHYGKYVCDDNPLKGKEKPGVPHRERALWWTRNAQNWRKMAAQVWAAKRAGHNIGKRIEDRLADNLAYAARDGLQHSARVGDDPSDGFYSGPKGGAEKRSFAFADRVAAGPPPDSKL